MAYAIQTYNMGDGQMSPEEIAAHIKNLREKRAEAKRLNAQEGDFWYDRTQVVRMWRLWCDYEEREMSFSEWLTGHPGRNIKFVQPLQSYRVRLHGEERMLFALKYAEIDRMNIDSL